jgi:hypothetical protein
VDRGGGREGGARRAGRVGSAGPGGRAGRRRGGGRGAREDNAREDARVGAAAEVKGKWVSFESCGPGHHLKVPPCFFFYFAQLFKFIRAVMM